jgi:hypothetical protein
VNTNVLSRLIAAAAQVNPLSAVPEAGLRLPSPDSGQYLRGQVQARLTDGTFRVMVDGVAVKLALAPGTQTGDVVELRVPPGAQGDARAPSAPTAASRDVQASVSDAGRLLGQALEEQTPRQVRQSQPVVEAPTRDTLKLATSLARAVERSGLFYESHQARWASGEFPLARLLEEPQARLHDGAPRAGPHAAAPDAPVPAAAVDAAADNEPAEAGMQSSQLPAAPVDKESAPPVAHEALPIVRQQIETLEQQRVVWHGEVWPGQPMDWEIVDERGSGTHADGGAAHDWSTSVALDLPSLGQVAIDLKLGANGLSLALVANTPGTEAAMRTRAPELAGALEAAGLRLRALTVRHGERTV